MIDKLAKAINEGYMNGVVLLDLRKAFDLIDHSILLQKQQMYKCSTNSVNWFSSYLQYKTDIKVHLLMVKYLPNYL
jgi:hypothetical protein